MKWSDNVATDMRRAMSYEWSEVSVVSVSDGGDESPSIQREMRLNRLICYSNRFFFEIFILSRNRSDHVMR